ncbi:NAD(P)-dependent alcohol dehydrogenase [Nocardiopsis tropica]|uniref:NAD(P)-dependent alcohol dehydrogenase n=1 Tax=Nocardiopsis tropica TaxID=109330 RepID=A0ABU7KWC6_9ACTN|nr:NAD(P)-dependent alcohol dehydrogenase [Nocardiopsis umidischolae]MEE2053611.1 NAD(P)-dependent alcohol dehydrogenase [Nocardiopsis umidischolae]
MGSASLMRAALYDGYGPPEVLYEGRVPVPTAGPGQLLVRVHAVSVNGGERLMRSGRLRWVTGRSFPKRVGMDFAGEVAETGPGATGYRVGDRVWGLLPRMGFGSAAEYVAVPTRQVSLAPEGVDLVEAAALPVGTTSITALRDKARLRSGERVLVRGASGGVGNTAVQLAKAMGGRVTGLASARHLDLVRELGAEEAFDYAATPLAELGRFDVVVDSVGSDLPALRRLLAPGGRMIGLSFDSAAMVGYILASYAFGSRRVRFFSGQPRHALFADLTRYVEEGALRPVVDTVHPLSDVAAAHRALEAGGVRGKHVVRVV